MKLENRFKKAASAARKREEAGKRKRPEIPDGLLKKCNACKSVIVAEALYLPQMQTLFPNGCV